MKAALDHLVEALLDAERCSRGLDDLPGLLVASGWASAVELWERSESGWQRRLSSGDPTVLEPVERNKARLACGLTDDLFGSPVVRVESTQGEYALLLVGAPEREALAELVWALSQLAPLCVEGPPSAMPAKRSKHGNPPCFVRFPLPRPRGQD